jgi:hypothetical protein
LSQGIGARNKIRVTDLDEIVEREITVTSAGILISLHWQHPEAVCFCADMHPTKPHLLYVEPQDNNLAAT